MKNDATSLDDAPAAADRRQERRQMDESNHVKLRLSARIGGQDMDLEIVNIHYRGACFRLPKGLSSHLFENNDNLPPLTVILGNKKLNGPVKYRISWEDFGVSRSAGIEFIEKKTTEELARSHRFLTNSKFKPILSAQDPCDPTRIIFFSVENISRTGFLLRTSLTNKHLLPGMELKEVNVQFPGGSPIKANLEIANTRKILDSEDFSLGVFFQFPTEELQKEIGRYFSFCQTSEDEDDLSLDWQGYARPKQVKDSLTFRVVRNEAEYEQVLKLRYQSYAKHDKVKKGSTYRDQGEGLRNEGLILVGYLGSKLVVTAELRFGLDSLGFRSVRIFGPKILDHIDAKNTLEINKLAVHIHWQGSDVVLGLMQKMTAMVLARGGLDILIASTDELAPFYKKVGARFTGLAVPHPHLPDKKLNAMIIDRQIFFGSGRFTTIGFEKIYLSVYRHLEDLKVVPPMRTNLYWHLRNRTEKTILRLRSRKKPHPKDRLGEVRKPFRDDIVETERRWTKQHIISTVLLTYVVEAEEMIGKKLVADILIKLGMSRGYLAKQGAWVSVDFLNAFCDEFEQYGDLRALSKRAGTRSLSPDIAGINYYLVKFIATPEFGFRNFEKNASRFNKTRTYLVTNLTNKSVRVHIGIASPSLLPKHRESCDNWEASLEQSVALLSGRKGQVKKVSCCYHGDPDCTYEITWNHAAPSLKHHFKAFAFINIWAIAIFVAASQFSLPVAIIFVLLMTLGSLYLRHKKVVWDLISQRENALLEFERYQTDADQRYGDLQHAKDALALRLKESELLSEIAGMVQKQNSMGSILNICLTNFSQSFGYKRSCVMLCEESGRYLSMSAISGIESHGDLMWNFKIDLETQRDGSLFLSSVFKKGHSVLISNVDDHFFQFNEYSRTIIRALGIRSFGAVAIPSDNMTSNRPFKSWGVLIGEKSDTGDLMTRQDIATLERLAAHLGLAIDKQHKIDHEEKMRQVFQKYLPKFLVNQSLVLGQVPRLGGTRRYITCMFIDIRGFTRISSQVTPESAVDYLNYFFGIVCDICDKNSGSVDKFIGDGVFVTWGALSEVEQGETAAVKTMFDILRASSRINAELKLRRLPQANIGIGIHSGEALVGNVGSENRMEFTCIGHAVNLAARLQDLCKEYSCDAVVSQETMRSIATDHLQDGDFAIRTLENVPIRGLDQPYTLSMVKLSA